MNEIEDHGKFITFFGPIIKKKKTTFQEMCWCNIQLMFSKEATKMDEIFIIHLTLCSKCQIGGEDFVNFRGLLRKHKLYQYQYV